MKKMMFVIAIAIICVLSMSCSHNAEMLGIGSAFRIGSGEASVWYGDGLFLNSVSRENVMFQAEIDSNMGVTFNPDDGTYKGIKSIALEIGPQLGGYARELGEKNPEALQHYYEALAEYYKYRGNKDVQSPDKKSAISDEKSKSAIEGVVDSIKEAISSRKDKDADEKDGSEPEKDDQKDEEGGGESEKDADEEVCETCE